MNSFPEPTVDFHFFDEFDGLEHLIYAMGGVIVGSDTDVDLSGTYHRYIHAYCKCLDGILYPMTPEETRQAETLAEQDRLNVSALLPVGTMVPILA